MYIYIYIYIQLYIYHIYIYTYLERSVIGAHPLHQIIKADNSSCFGCWEIRAVHPLLLSSTCCDLGRNQALDPLAADAGSAAPLR